MNSTNVLFFVILLLIGFSAWREMVHDQERKHLLDRLMARDLHDLRSAESLSGLKPINGIRTYRDRVAKERG